MKTEYIETLNEIIETHPQFQKVSELYNGIIKAIGCTLERAKELASTHCNMISFYAILTTEGTYFGDYSEYFSWMLKKGYCDKHGYIKAEKSTILEELGITATLLKYNELEDLYNPIRLNPDKFYQIKIKGNTSGFHFMSGYIEDGIFKLSDTSYRGIGAIATDHINSKNFVWIMEI